MARSRELGSPSKEFPLHLIDQTLQAIRPGWTYSRLRRYAAAHTNEAIPGILQKRYLLLDDDDRIVYDRFLSLITSEPIDSARVRKVMYFTYFFRDHRIRRYICEVVAGSGGKWNLDRLS